MIDQEIDNIFYPTYFANVKFGKIEFAVSEGYNLEVLEILPNGNAKCMLCNLEGEENALNGKVIEVKPNSLKLIEL